MTLTRSLTCLTAAAALVLLAPIAAAAGVEAADAFETLKSLQGTWKATGEAGGEVFESTHVFAVSAAGTVVMETMNPGTPHEMINMYHLDGDDLVLTHYCAAGNQPTMRLVRESAKPGDLAFEFTGGTNLEATGHYIGGAHLIIEGDMLKSHWTSYAGGEEAGKMEATLTRASE